MCCPHTRCSSCSACLGCNTCLEPLFRSARHWGGPARNQEGAGDRAAAALTGLRKAGMEITVVRNVGFAARYRLTGSDAGTGDGVDRVVRPADLGAGA